MEKKELTEALDNSRKAVGRLTIKNVEYQTRISELEKELEEVRKENERLKKEVEMWHGSINR